MSEKINSLINECKQIKEDSEFTAEVHHIISRKLSQKSFWFKFIPALVTVVSAYKVISGNSAWAWIPMISGLITVLNIFLEPGKEAKEHLFSAKQFIVLKHEARSLWESFKDFMNEEEFYHNVRRLREKYNFLVQIVPATDDKKAVAEAQKNLKTGIHIADFRLK
ncbi:MAG: SLATT domain-containing protein [Candidatus Omnitrophica bacterium]|nr:SLATT domain-containing protein [Candidatus Omnitrophota bacterium]